MYISHSIMKIRVLHVKVMYEYFFKWWSNINDRQSDPSIDLYWLKFLLMSHDIVDANLNKGICLGVELQLKLSLSDLLFNTLFLIDCKVLNPYIRG
jgi:hypothetical protein